MPLASDPEIPASFQNLADPLADSLFLFVPFYFSMSFQSSRIAPIILRPNPLRQAVSPFFAYFLPPPQNPTPFLDNSAAKTPHFPLHSFSIQTVELEQFPQHPRPPKSPRIKKFLPPLVPVLAAAAPALPQDRQSHID